ncbi:MAG: hypothetical protein ACOX3T_01415 [Bdellovibrionota bacterium]
MELKKYTEILKDIKKIKNVKNVKISKTKVLLYAPSISLILAGSFVIFSPTMLKFFLACFLIFSGILSLKVIKRIYTTRNNILSILGQIDGQILIHKHHPAEEDDDRLFSQYSNKKNMFH